MAIPTLIVASLGAVLDLSDVALQRLGTDRVKTLLSQLGDHFSLSATDLAQAYQDAFRLGMSAISLGIAPAEWGGRPDSRDRMLTSTVPRDFAWGLSERSSRRVLKPTRRIVWTPTRSRIVWSGLRGRCPDRGTRTAARFVNRTRPGRR